MRGGLTCPTGPCCPGSQATARLRSEQGLGSGPALELNGLSHEPWSEIIQLSQLVLGTHTVSAY